jgi:hypothetical protein
MIFPQDSGQQIRAQLPTWKAFFLWRNDPVVKSIAAVGVPQ